MNLHYGKSEAAVHYHLSSCNYPVYSINGMPAENLSTHWYSGVFLSSNLSWSIHYNHTCQKLYCFYAVFTIGFTQIFLFSWREGLYPSIDSSHLMIYCMNIKTLTYQGIPSIQNIKHCETKYILFDLYSDYKSRLVTLWLFPLMFIYPGCPFLDHMPIGQVW